ncbi:hypothetical protein Goklo_009480 [Gossypium klotzschianum]|uniref:Uncharacterized protein n=1 Tax=Gossypium klotzschianum TaxID=34286 RepID=A0A7J8V401_9ROSI|nr:hypothetical protein [Gossypium klotzschianum]
MVGLMWTQNCQRQPILSVIRGRDYPRKPTLR